MPKSKKKKNADFQKVKLKVGKKLPKGDNVTNLSFKTRQIQLTQKIRDGDSKELMTKRHLSVQELLRQCDHHSCSNRVNAISGLKEVWLDHYEELMIPSSTHGYGEILKKLSGMLIDNEAVVRHSVINLIKLMFNKMCKHPKSPANSMIGGDLFKHIHAFLCCAMNHIHEDVRLDSLVLFDVLFDAFPQFMVQHTGDLLGNLVAMISSPIRLGAKGDVTTQKLSMNPESKLLAMKFRARVLLRIKHSLQEALNCSMRSEHQSSQNSNVGNDHIWSLYFESKNNSIKQSTVIVSKNCRKRFQMIFTDMSHEGEYSILKPRNLEAFMHQSMPVLLQCWKEARATTSATFVTENGVSEDSTDVMTLVLTVIDLIFSLVSISTSGDRSHQLCHFHTIPPSVMVQNYCSEFVSVFMTQFPFSVTIEKQLQKKRKRKKASASIENPVTQQSLTAMNLDICHIMSCFCADLTASFEDEWLGKIQAYLIQILRDSPSVGRCQALVKILKNIYLHPNSLDHCTLAVKATWDFYSQCRIESPEKIILFDMFATIFATWNGWRKDDEESRPICHYQHNSEMEGILKSFCDSFSTLLEYIPRQGDNLTWMQRVLSLLSHSVNCLGVKAYVEACLSNILDPVKGVVAMDNEAIHEQILTLLSQGVALNKEQFQHLLYSIRRPVEHPLLPHRRSRSLACQAIGCVGLSIRKIVPLLSQKEFNNISSSQHEQLSTYLKFLFSLQIGMNKEEMEELILSKDEAKTDLDEWLTVSWTLAREQWERHIAIATYVAVELTALYIPASPSEGYEQPFTFIDSMERLWIQTIAAKKGIHIMSAYSLVKFVQMAFLPQSVEKPSKSFCRFVSRVIASVLASLYGKETKVSDVEEKILDDVKSEMMYCLTKVPCLLQDTWKKLVHGSEGACGMFSEDKESAVMALELLRSENVLMQNISLVDTS